MSDIKITRVVFPILSIVILCSFVIVEFGLSNPNYGWKLISSKILVNGRSVHAAVYKSDEGTVVLDYANPKFPHYRYVVSMMFRRAGFVQRDSFHFLPSVAIPSQADYSFKSFDEVSGPGLGQSVERRLFFDSGGCQFYGFQGELVRIVVHL